MGHHWFVLSQDGCVGYTYIYIYIWERLFCRRVGNHEQAPAMLLSSSPPLSGVSRSHVVAHLCDRPAGTAPRGAVEHGTGIAGKPISSCALADHLRLLMPGAGCRSRELEIKCDFAAEVRQKKKAV